MNRLRRLSTDYLLPLVISALVLRALIPVGFMPSAGSGFSLTAQMCNVPAGNVRTETIEISAGDTPFTAAAMHCDYCALPVLGTALSVTAASAAVPSSSTTSVPAVPAPFSRFALQRAQIPRAPPLA